VLFSLFEINQISLHLVQAFVFPFQLKKDNTFTTMKFGIAALVLGSSLAPSAVAFSFFSSIASKSGSSPKNAYSVSKTFNPPTAGSSYLDGIANNYCAMSASNVYAETVSSSLDNSDVMFIRSEYNAWLQRYGKASVNESRYVNFKANFLALQEHERQTGKSLMMNEFADYSAEEFAQEKARSNAPTGSDVIRSEYNAWLQRYGKTSANESRYSNFKANFWALQDNERQTGKFLIMNEFADYSADQFAQEFAQLNAGSNAPTGSDVMFIRSEYNAWLQRYGKTSANESRYSNFKANFLALQEHERQTGKSLMMNEFADYNAEQFAKENAGSNAPTGVPASATATPKKSYAPGAGGKPAAPATSGMGSYLTSVAQAVAAATPQSYAPSAASAAPPVAAAASGTSYLSSVSNPAMGSGSPVPKKGYAPGQGSKPMSPASSGIGSSYLSFVSQAASTSFAPVSSSAPAAATHAGANSASYLNSVSTVTGSGSATPKKSYAPGAGGKSWGPTSSGIGSS
jgi:predicted DNA-binding transcriptional regulator AlpA